MKYQIMNMLLAVFILGNASCSQAYDYPEAKITIKVVDESGMPVPAEEVTVGFEVPEGTRQGIKSVIIKGTTDSEGYFSVTHKTIGVVGYKVNKDGYYGSYGEYRSTNEESGRWQPWNPEVKLVLRKKDNPVPMYARNSQMSRLEVPVVGKEVGFDLMEYEWVPPYGKGKHADIVFKIDRKFKNDQNFESTLTMTFSSKHDGIQLVKQSRKYGSAFKLPRFAPETGYKSKLIRTMKRAPGKSIESDFEEDSNYIFRVRSEEKDGKLWRAMYGKIQGDIQVEPRGRETAAILFTYYLNPDYTRNLEYGSNLFKNLRDIEEVGLE